jgi:hypothetical protein
VTTVVFLGYLRRDIMASSDYIHETPEKAHVSGDSAVDEDNLKPGSTEESGEVFQQAKYRALGW